MSFCWHRDINLQCPPFHSVEVSSCGKAKKARYGKTPIPHCTRRRCAIAIYVTPLWQHGLSEWWIEFIYYNIKIWNLFVSAIQSENQAIGEIFQISFFFSSKVILHTTATSERSKWVKCNVLYSTHGVWKSENFQFFEAAMTKSINSCVLICIIKIIERETFSGKEGIKDFQEGIGLIFNFSTLVRK